MAMIIALLAFLSDLCNSMTQPTVSILAINLGASYDFIGTMVAVSSLSRLLIVQPVGTLSDRLDKRFFLTLGFLCYLINFSFLFFAYNPLHILIGRVIGGMGSAMFYTSAVALILTSDSKSKGMDMGVYATLMGIGFSLGPLIGGFIAQNYSYNASYLLSIVFAVIALPLAILGLGKKNMKKNELLEKSKKHEKVNLKKLLSNKELLITCIGGFFISESLGADTSFFPVYGKTLLLSEGIIGSILSIRALLSTIVRIPIGKATELVNPKKFMMVALVLSSLGLFLIPQFNIVWLFPLFLGLEGIGYGIFLTSANIHIGNVTDEGSKGSAVGLYSTFSGIGGVFNMTILGLIASTLGLANTFRFTSLTCLFGFILIIILSFSRVRARVR